ncbi:putative bifunctional diguanylate cyclase/phosphodiesterase [Sphingorhabdus sp. M41]|uniref:putative bifunctional diguanylate cyclase/phosphodiesterase n=1 Tax=Sphingorhabdus sp. M41 TaxID=1806885 RepID=UPI00078E49F0|nr:EAL domain-containing protein [Sphingorhabdus sp. M41]AMO72636.1 hypothetical protein AZE99_12950 [Sphingorhabdus sp. M41]
MTENATTEFRSRWNAMTSARRDSAMITAVGFLAWLVIERTETCDRFFDWVANHPDYEVDSLILAFILAAIGIAVFAVRRYHEMLTVSDARDLAEQHVHSLAFHDPLTGLPNRWALLERLSALCAEGATQHAALIFIDLDRFKDVNDLHGHAAGDRLLRLVADRLRSEIEDEQICYRLGGDEFAIIVEMPTADDKMPQTVASHLVHTMAEPFFDNSLVHHIEASAGISIFPSDADQPDALARAADVALYRAKDAGRGLHKSYEAAMDDQIKRRAILKGELRTAIIDQEFFPHYQPLIDLETGLIVGFELLARWNRKDDQTIGPDQFISIAEESGLINDLMFGLLDKTCIEARNWDPALTIAINISPVQLKDPWLSQKILGALARHGFAPSRLAIEITENAIIGDEENAKRTIRSLKNQGMRIGLDDFGTGYSSLHHLRMLPFDKIKIDRSFIMKLGEDPEAFKIVKAIVGLATTLDLRVIAEGIECPEVAAILKLMGCAQGQGYHFGRPISGEAVSRKLVGPHTPNWTQLNDTPPFDLPARGYSV